MTSTRFRASGVAVIAAAGLALADPALASAMGDTFATLMDTAMATMDKAMMAQVAEIPTGTSPP